LYRNYHLARLHTIHPVPSFSSAIQLLTRASDRLSLATTALSTSPQEPIHTPSPSILSTLSTNITTLSAAAKRALYAERIAKPVFFDTAFNYIDLPMDELLVLAGKSGSSGAGAGIIDALGGIGHVEPAKIVQGVKEGVKGVVEGFRNEAGAVEGGTRERTREATPAIEAGATEGKQKGWLGGWFGKK
jgi:signal recognition particle subunit SRP68